MRRPTCFAEIKKGDPAAQGFSLLEVLVATALLGLCLVAFMQVLHAGWRAQVTSVGRTQALFEAEKVLQQYCQGEHLVPGIHQGGQGRHTYKVAITPQFEVSLARYSRKLVCYLVQVTVFWQEGGRTKSLALETIRTVTRGSS